MAKKTPTISILLPVYNAGKFLRPAVKSLTNQTHSDWELIAIDDSSTDDSYNILKILASVDSRIRIYKNAKNLGISATLNRAIKLSRGQFLARMDADDISLPDRLEKQLNFLKNHPNTVLVGGQCTVIDSHGHQTGKKLFPLKHEEIYQLAFNRSPVQHPAIMINRDLVPHNFSWYNTKFIPAEDLDLFFRLFHYGKFSNLRDFVLKYRRHTHNTSLINPQHTYKVAQEVRQHAYHYHAYRPNLIAKATNLAQRIIVSHMPRQLIYPLYLLATGSLQMPKIASIKLFSSPALAK